MEPYSSLGLTSVKYTISKLSRVEKELVIVRIQLKILGKIWSKCAQKCRVESSCTPRSLTVSIQVYTRHIHFIRAKKGYLFS